MAAGENQPQPVVFYILIFTCQLCRGSRRVKLLGELHKRRIESGASPHTVDCFKAASGNQPRPRICRYPIARPLLHCRNEGVVQCLFGEVEIPQQSDECGENPPRVRAVDFVDNFAYPFGTDSARQRSTLMRAYPCIRICPSRTRTENPAAMPPRIFLFGRQSRRRRNGRDAAPNRSNRDEDPSRSGPSV